MLNTPGRHFHAGKPTRSFGCLHRKPVHQTLESWLRRLFLRPIRNAMVATFQTRYFTAAQELWYGDTGRHDTCVCVCRHHGCAWDTKHVDKAGLYVPACPSATLATNTAQNQTNILQQHVPVLRLPPLLCKTKRAFCKRAPRDFAHTISLGQNRRAGSSVSWLGVFHKATSNTAVQEQLMDRFKPIPRFQNVSLADRCSLQCRLDFILTRAERVLLYRLVLVYAPGKHLINTLIYLAGDVRYGMGVRTTGIPTPTHPLHPNLPPDVFRAFEVPSTGHQRREQAHASVDPAAATICATGCTAVS